MWHRTHWGGGDTAQKKCKPGGGTPNILPEQGDTRAGHRTKFQTSVVGRVGGWVAAWPGAGWLGGR